jgi:hypothetical protein
VSRKEEDFKRLAGTPVPPEDFAAAFFAMRQSERGNFGSVNFRLCDGSGIAVRKDRSCVLENGNAALVAQKSGRLKVILV